VSVLVLFKWEGDPDEHLAAYDRELAHPALASRAASANIPHLCASRRWDSDR
jgi:hypothetical protein